MQISIFVTTLLPRLSTSPSVSTDTSAPDVQHEISSLALLPKPSPKPSGTALKDLIQKKVKIEESVNFSSAQAVVSGPRSAQEHLEPNAKSLSVILACLKQILSQRHCLPSALPNQSLLVL